VLANVRSDEIVLYPSGTSPKSIHRQHGDLIQLPSFTPPTGYITKDPNSYLLFEHYQAVTARFLPVTMWIQNPFVSYVLPLAHSNDLIMQAVLALSGVHLCFSSSSTEVKTATWTHYALALRNIKNDLSKKLNGDDVDILHLLLATLLLCLVEVCYVSSTIYCL